MVSEWGAGGDADGSGVDADAGCGDAVGAAGVRGEVAGKTVARYSGHRAALVRGQGQHLRGAR